MPKDHSYEVTAAGVNAVSDEDDSLLPTLSVVFWFKDREHASRFAGMLRLARDTGAAVRAEPVPHRAPKETP